MGRMRGTELASHPDWVTPRLLANTAGDQQKQQKVTANRYHPFLAAGWAMPLALGCKLLLGEKTLVQWGCWSSGCCQPPQKHTCISLCIYIYTLFIHIYIKK